MSTPERMSERFFRALAHETLARILSSPAGFLVGSRAHAVAQEESVALTLALSLPDVVTLWEPVPSLLSDQIKKLKENELNILEACPAFGKPLIRIKDLRERSGYGRNRYFDCALDRLLDMELLVRLSGGVRKSRTFDEKYERS